MRRSYETESDRQNEIRVASLLESQGYDVKRLKRYYPCDFLLSKDGVSYIAEYKRRNYKFTKFPSVMIAALKIANCLSLAFAMQAKFILLAEYDDGLYFTTDPSGDVEYGGRTDREPDEFEPMIMIPTHKFKRLL